MRAVGIDGRIRPCSSLTAARARALGAWIARARGTCGRPRCGCTSRQRDDRLGPQLYRSGKPDIGHSHRPRHARGKRGGGSRQPSRPCPGRLSQRLILWSCTLNAHLSGRYAVWLSQEARSERIAVWRKACCRTFPAAEGCFGAIRLAMKLDGPPLPALFDEAWRSKRTAQSCGSVIPHCHRLWRHFHS